jgi:hypothetical protein
MPVVAQLTGPRDVSYAEVGRFVAERIGADPALVDPVSAAAPHTNKRTKGMNDPKMLKSESEWSQRQGILDQLG